MDIVCTPDTYWFVGDIFSNGVSVGASTNLHWRNITEEGSIEVCFDAQTASGGTPYWWLADHQLITGEVSFDEAETFDSDLDGFSNGLEWVCDTNPNDAGSLFEINRMGSPSTPSLRVYSSLNRIYSLFKVDSLTTGIWEEVCSVQGTGDWIDFETDLFAVTNTAFYRVRVHVKQ